jgi:hypothetical protein
MGSALSNPKPALAGQAHSENLGKAALSEFQRKFGHTEVETTGTHCRGDAE